MYRWISSNEITVIISASLYSHIMFGHPLDHDQYHVFANRLVNLKYDRVEQVTAISDDKVDEYAQHYDRITHTEEEALMARFNLCQNLIYAYKSLRNNHV